MVKDRNSMEMETFIGENSSMDTLRVMASISGAMAVRTEETSNKVKEADTESGKPASIDWKATKDTTMPIRSQVTEFTPGTTAGTTKATSKMI